MMENYNRQRQQKQIKQNPIRRPALQYYGGKWMLAKWVIEHLPEHKLYVEPFGGAASVLLRKPRSYREVYNDLNQEVVNFFKVIRHPQMARKLIAMLKVTPFSRHEFNKAYLPSQTPIERARRLAIRSFMSFNGNGASKGGRASFKWQISKKTGSTAAIGWKNYPYSLVKVIERMRGVIVEQRPALEIITAYDDKDTLFYVDPPYLWHTRAKGAKSNGYQHEMDNKDHEALLKQLLKLKGSCVLSGYDNSFYNEMLTGWKKYTRSSYASGSKPRQEVIWVKSN